MTLQNLLGAAGARLAGVNRSCHDLSGRKWTFDLQATMIIVHVPLSLQYDTNGRHHAHRD